MITVRWFSTTAKQAEIWRILDLSGLTKSVRESREFTRAHYVFLNNNQVSSVKSTVEIGIPFRLELRFPNGKVVGADIMVVNRMYPPARQRRSLDPLELRRKG